MADENDDIDLLASGKKAFQRCQDHESENRQTALEDIRFSRLGEQWPDAIRTEREAAFRPCLTINKMPAFIRQVVNDARQNKPSIKVHPADSKADPKTADIINGLIRNIEYTSNADVSYDTAGEQAVTSGFGYWRVGLDYAYADAFDMDLTIQRISNQFSVYGDPNSTAADSSDWDVAFVVDRMPKEEFKRKYKGKTNSDEEPVTVDFSADQVWNDWVNDDGIMIAEWWRREEVPTKVYQLSNGHTYTQDQLESDPDVQIGIATGSLQIVKERDSKKHKVTQVIMSGADVLEVNDWPGCFIPIIPVYGDEIIVEGKRYFRGLIHSAKDAQRMVNYWRSTSTELVALAPRVPFIGEEGAFDADPNWTTANTKNHSYLEYKQGKQMPQRQPMDSGPAGGALQEALNAADDMKAIMGLHDASLGARSNETSGRAILARQREGDIATFHFVDNISRAIRHTGRVLIDLIPKVYSGERIVRVLGEDGTPENVPINQQAPETDENGKPVVDEMGQAIMAMHDITTGKYDLTVTTGPSFTTRREEAAAQMTELVRAFPQAAPFVADIMAKNFDWPGADEIAKRFEAMNPMKQQEVPPQIQQALQELQAKVQELTGETQRLKDGHDIKMFEAETKRMQVTGDMKMDQAQLGVSMLKMSEEPQAPTRQG